MNRRTQSNYQRTRFTSPRYENRCVTYKCQSQDLPTNTQPNRVKRVSRINDLLFQTKNTGVFGSNLFDEKITWFKSLSPKPKNIIFHYVSPPKILTRSMIKEMRECQSIIIEQNNQLMTPTKSMKKSQRITDSKYTKTLDSIINNKNCSSDYQPSLGNPSQNVKSDLSFF